jgi:hypothetical protein
MSALNNPKAIAVELAIINDPATAEERPAIVDLIDRLHAATSAQELSELHTKLLVRYLARQRLRDELNDDKTSVRGQIAALADKTGSLGIDVVRVGRS